MGPTAEEESFTSLESSPKLNIIAIPRFNQVVEKKSVPAFGSQAERGFGVRENASKEKGPVMAADPKISKAPNLPERNLYHDFNTI
jgi:hypothetical protein